MYRRVTNKFIYAAVAVLAGISVYTVIGIYVNNSNVRIYDRFPEEFSCYPSNGEVKLSCQIRNNAPMSLPFINPFYATRIEIVDSESNSFAYFEGVGHKARNFTEYSLDLGRIDSGDYEDFDFFLHPDQSNLTFTAKVFLNFGPLRLESASSVYAVEYQGDYKYIITKDKQ